MNLMRRFATIAVFALSVGGVGWMNTAYSETITYALTAGIIDGTLNGVPFSGKSFTMTAEADPTNFTAGFAGPGSFPIYSQTATTTMTIAGFSPFQITTASFGPFVLDYSPYIPGVFFDGFGVFTGSDLNPYIAASGYPSGSVIDGTGSLDGQFSPGTQFLNGPLPITLSTSVGDLVINNAGNAGATFSGSIAPVPEPATYAMALAGMACGGFSLWRRRKRA